MCGSGEGVSVLVGRGTLVLIFLLEKIAFKLS